MCSKYLCPFTDAMANPSPAKSIGDPGITPLSPSHTQVTDFSSGLNIFLCLILLIICCCFVLLAVYVQYFETFLLLTNKCNNAMNNGWCCWLFDCCLYILIAYWLWVWNPAALFAPRRSQSPPPCKQLCHSLCLSLNWIESDLVQLLSCRVYKWTINWDFSTSLLKR